MDKAIYSKKFKPSINKRPDWDLTSQEEISSQKQEITDPGKYLLCRQCLQVITHRSLKMIINGAHEHTFANPHGIVYEIGCFQSASGCGYVGSPTDEFSWFNGFRWQVAVCASCLTHLGWLFTSSSMDSFIGLILDRLAETR